MKTVEIFRTDVKNSNEADLVISLLMSLFPSYAINFDLDDDENILRVETHHSEIQVAKIIMRLFF